MMEWLLINGFLLTVLALEQCRPSERVVNILWVPVLALLVGGLIFPA